MPIPINILNLFESIDSQEHRFDKQHALRAVEQLFEGHEPARVRAIRYLGKIGVLDDHSFYLMEQKEDIDDLIDIHRMADESKIPFHVLKAVFHQEIEKTNSKEIAFHNVGKYIKKHLAISESKNNFEEKLNKIDDSTIDKLASKIKTISDLIDHYKPEDFSYHINEATAEEKVWGHIKKVLKRASKRVKLKKKSRPKAVIHRAKAVAKRLLVAHLFHHEDHEHVSPEVEHAIVRSSAYKKLVSKLSPKIAKIEDEAVREHHEIHEEMEPLQEPVSSLPTEKSPYKYIHTTDKVKEVIFDGSGSGKSDSHSAGTIAYLVREKDTKNKENDNE
jgi:hypothetical protein